MFMRTDFCRAANHCLCAADQRYRVWHNRHRGSRHGDTEELHEDQRPEERRPEERAAASNIQRRALQECCHEIYPESWSYYVWPVGVYSHYCHDFMHHCRPIVRGDFADFDIANEDDQVVIMDLVLKIIDFENVKYYPWNCNLPMQSTDMKFQNSITV